MRRVSHWGWMRALVVLREGTRQNWLHLLRLQSHRIHGFSALAIVMHLLTAVSRCHSLHNTNASLCRAFGHDTLISTPRGFVAFVAVVSQRPILSMVVLSMLFNGGKPSDAVSPALLSPNGNVGRVAFLIPTEDRVPASMIPVNIVSSDLSLSNKPGFRDGRWVTRGTARLYATLPLCLQAR